MHMEQEKFIVIDGNSLMHRAFYAIPKLTNSKGFHTNVIYGFVNMLNKIIEEYKPQFIGIAFDRKAPTFRHLEYAEYKAGRQKMPEEMAEQIQPLKEVIAAMNIKQVELDGFEADDIIGTITKHCDELGIPALIVTGDKDALQLISDNVHKSFQGSFPSLNPDDTERILSNIKFIMDSNVFYNNTPVILCSPRIRPAFRRMLEMVFPEVPVISMNEVPGNIGINSVGVVSLD
jgi:DNA polymerase-1